MGNPVPLKQNAKKSFQGSIVLGKGFVLTPQEAATLIAKDPRNKDVLFPYLNGDDLNNDPEQKPSRWVINFFDWPEEKARLYPDCFEIVERLVKPERQRWKVDSKGKEIPGTFALRGIRAQKWWLHAERAKALYETISKLDQGIISDNTYRNTDQIRLGKVLARSLTSKHHSLTFATTANVIDQTCVVFCYNSDFEFCILMSDVHFQWIVKASANLGGTGRYNLGAGFETFPFPRNLSPDLINHLNQIGAKYYNHREKLLSNLNIGLTKLYNLFHSKNLTISDVSKITKKNDFQIVDAFNSILELRSTHAQINEAVLTAYGWNDIKLSHDFYEMEYLPEKDRLRFTIHPFARKEIQERLLELNYELYQKEIVSHPSSKKKTNSSLKTIDLFSREH
jgi:hypothetical protein